MAPNSLGRKFVITIFGASHGKGIGIVIDGLPANGMELDKSLIQWDLNRRRPGQSEISTPRDEKDLFEILSGVTENEDGKIHLTGSPLTFFIKNQDTRSKDYSLFRDVHRPSQIDYPALLRFGEKVDIRGSGVFSGRLTAPIVMAGSVAKMILKNHGVKLAAFVSKIGTIEDEEKDSYSVDTILENVEKNIVRTVDSDISVKMIDLINDIKAEEDSIGGIVSVRVENFPKGIGDPWFDSIESVLAHGIMSIPGVRGIEFGSGFSAVEMKGSQHNDPFIVDENTKEILTKTNHCGGIIGGISIGTPITFNVPIKPTASIGKKQTTLNFQTKEMTTLKIEGRHDPCIAPRALVGIESMTAIVLVDTLLNSKLL